MLAKRCVDLLVCIKKRKIATFKGFISMKNPAKLQFTVYLQCSRLEYTEMPFLIYKQIRLRAKAYKKIQLFKLLAFSILIYAINS